MHIELSYIIPAYNATTFIRQTLDEIFALPLNKDEYEVIVIDDCSTDNTLEVLHQIQEKHANLIVIRQEHNQRQGAARNKGFEIARGEYIAFCDADDRIVADGVMNALRAVRKSKVDICYFDFEYELQDGLWQRFKMPNQTHNTILSAEEYLNKYYTCYYNAPWRCLYRTEFLHTIGIRFVEGVRWEDCDWTVKVYAKAKNIQFVDGVGYRYGWNDAATSRQMDAQAMAEQIMAGVRLTLFAREIENELPELSQTIAVEAKYRYIINNIRLRNLSKYGSSYLKKVYHIVIESDWKLLETIALPVWESMVVRYHVLSLCSLSIISPVASLGRNIANLMRR